MEREARVASVNGGRARLACERRLTCGTCGSGHGCALSRLFGPGRATLEVPDRTDDRQPLQVGQAVTLTLPEGELLRTVTLAYLPPLCGLLLAPILARTLAGAGDGGLLLAAIGGVSAGGWLARVALARRPPRVLVRHAHGGDRSA